MEDKWSLPDGRTLSVTRQRHPMGGLLLLFKDITDSVWLIKKHGEEDGFQEWHQDMKTTCSSTIVLNIGVVAGTTEKIHPKISNSHDTRGIQYNPVLKTYYLFQVHGNAITAYTR
jgi:hypothetical protein